MSTRQLLQQEEYLKHTLAGTPASNRHGLYETCIAGQRNLDVYSDCYIIGKIIQASGNKSRVILTNKVLHIHCSLQFISANIKVHMPDLMLHGYSSGKYRFLFPINVKMRKLYKCTALCDKFLCLRVL